MFKIKRFMTFFGAAMLLILTSCEFGSLEKREASGSVVVDLSSVKDRITSSSRTAYKDLLSSDFETFADLKLEGDFETSQTINLNETEIVQIDNIPVGSKITASIEIYINIDLQDEGRSFKETKWHGTSDQYEIKDGPNEIVIPLSRGGNEEIIDEPEEEDKRITIYVRYDENKQGNILNEAENSSNEDPANDGKTKETGFYYIQSAINWIAENGNRNSDYKILLTGYNETHAFNQIIYSTSSHDGTATAIFGKTEAEADNLRTKSNSITLTGERSDCFAINTTNTDCILIRTPVPIYLENIRISTTNHSRIIFTNYGISSEVYLTGETVFSDITDPEVMDWAGSSAVQMEGGTVTMQDYSIIENFYSSNGGAAHIKYGEFIMEGNSRINECKASTDGGAIYLEPNGSPLFTLKENATIYKCASRYDGGAIAQVKGTVTIEGGNIIDCEAEGDTSHGGAIYIKGASNHPKTYLKGGTIKGNKAKIGSAFYLEQNDGTASLILSDNACVDSSNDIYTYRIPIQLKTALTTENETAAIISYPQGITPGTDTILVLYSDDFGSGEPDSIVRSHSKFIINEKNISTNEIINTYAVDENGTIIEN